MTHIKARIFFTVFFMLAQDASAVELDRDSIGEKSYFIQVGAFKNISNIQKVSDKLSRYEVYLEPYKDMHRIYIVNIFSPSQKKILAKVRKIYPNAFIAKGPTKAKKTILTAKTFTNFNKSLEITPYKPKNTQFLNQPLDSNSILKTRKSFL